MIKSMTAFGRAEIASDEGTFVVEIRCVNRRYGEVSVRLPQLWLPLEDRIKKLVTQRVARGRVDVTVRMKVDGGIVPQIAVNVPLAKAHFEALRDLTATLGIKEPVALDTLLGIEGIITVCEPEVDLERSWGVLSRCVLEALGSVEAMRVAEGQAIYDDFKDRLEKIEQQIHTLKAMAPSVLSDYHQRLTERIKVLTEGRVELDPSRLAQEAAFLADKSDITEEIVRAESHVKQFRTMLETEEPVGRALDFLLQELNREINTIGSKAGDAELSQKVVGLKSEIEKIREQVQNVE